jgi:CRISPR-associated helicase Cas3
MKFRVAAYSLPLVRRSGVNALLYPHQAAIWDRWEQDKTTLLAAKTGTGKTRAVMLPLLARKESGVAVYPTNELLRDQVRAIKDFANKEGFKVATRLPGTDDRDCAGADSILVPIDRKLLTEWQEISHSKSRIATLERVLDNTKPTIILTNPDILFLILAMRYHAGPLELLRRHETLVFDEFHLYQGVELAHALVMIGMARSFGFFKRVMLLSATPQPDVKAMLDRLYAPYVIEPADTSPGPQSRIAVHAVEVEPMQVSLNDPVDALVARITLLRAEFQRLRAENSANEYIPGVVIVSSVVNAISLEDKLVETGIPRDSLAIIRGLSNRDIRSTTGKLLAIGTSAIEVGVDFQCDYLLFEATDSASFMQRFGRVGRHRPGKAIALVPPSVYAGMSALPPEMDRASFEERINSWYPSSDSKPWFVTTEYGMITARALVETFISIANEEGVDAATEIQLRERVEDMLNKHSERLGCPEKNKQARGAFERCRKGLPLGQWLKVYCSLSQFRTSLPSVTVHDFTEQKRRAQWALAEYEADLRTLLKRAVGIIWNPKLDRLTIKGIGKLRSVHASEIFSDCDCGPILQTKDYDEPARALRLYQDNESTPISDLMSKKNHIFALAKRKDVDSDLDWRLPVFEAGKDYLLAFDGAALLLLEMARRNPLRNAKDTKEPAHRG